MQTCKYSKRSMLWRNFLIDYIRHEYIKRIVFYRQFFFLHSNITLVRSISLHK